MRFDAFEVSLQTIHALRGPLARLARQDPDLGSQVKRAASSVCLNLSEGNKRTGKDKIHHFRIASGSAAEVRAALRVAEAFGYLEPETLAPSLQLLDRVLAMLWRLTR